MGSKKLQESANTIKERHFDLFRLKKSEDQIKDVTIQQTGFLQLLRELGYRRYDVQDSWIIIHLQDKIIEQVTIYQLRERIARYFLSRLDEWEEEYSIPPGMLFEKLHRSLGSLTTEEKICLLVPLEKSEEITICEDTITSGFYFYQNGYVEVTKKGYELKPYKDLPGYVWRDQILPRNFTKCTQQQIEEGVYWRFAENVSGVKRDEAGQPISTARLQSFITITGYNLHRFFQTKLRCTIFLDARTSDEPDGRSGKSLHTKGIRAILNADPINGKQCITIDGKNYDPSNRFKYDKLHVSTKLVIFDDVKKGFNIEDLFNIIVDGFERERKGDMTKVMIFAKIIFTLNYTLRISGGSARDRVVEFEFADYYSSKFSPEQEFGQWFFRDWDAAEWSRFDNFMMMCVQEYLYHGIIMPDTINLEARKLRDETCLEFISLMEDLQISHEQVFNKKDLYGKFVDLGEDGKIRNKDLSWLKPRSFTAFLRKWAEYRPEMAGYREYRSNGSDFFQFFHNLPLTNEKHTEGVFLPGKSDKCKLDIPF